jgi:hypothetical protein
MGAIRRRGETGGGVDVSIKDRWDIPLNGHPSWSDAQQMLNDAVLAVFKRYLRRYPHIALATSRLQLPRSDGGAPVTLDAERLAQADGELHPSPEDYGESLHRVVLWTICLNDNFSEGETEFLCQLLPVLARVAGAVLNQLERVAEGADALDERLGLSFGQRRGLGLALGPGDEGIKRESGGDQASTECSGH